MPLSGVRWRYWMRKLRAMDFLLFGRPAAAEAVFD